MSRSAFRRTTILALAGAALLAAPLAAQFQTDGFEFRKAVKDRDGEAATNFLNQPGNVLINSRDVTSGETALHIVTQRRDTTWIRFLTQRGANPNIADRNGVTPLVVASNLGYFEGVEALIKAGARVDVANNAGETPLIAAVHRRDIPMVRLLLENGANPDQNDNSGRSARDYVALVGSQQLSDELERADEKRGSGDGQIYGPSIR